jgi:hypothetical protein
MDIWRESQNAGPLALGFGGAHDRISDRIQNLSSKIDLFPRTFGDFKYALDQKSQLITPFENFLHTLDECNDFLYDFAVLQNEPYSRKRRLESPRLEYPVPRYVYTEKEIVSLENRIDFQLKVMRAHINHLLL